MFTGTVLMVWTLIAVAPGKVAASEPTDDEVATVSLKILTGAFHDISGEGVQLTVKSKIGPKMTATLDRRAEQLARKTLEKQGKKGGEGPVLMCMRENHIRGDESKNALGRCYRKENTSWPALHSCSRSLGARMFYFDALIDYIKDPKVRTKARHMMAFRLGWQPVFFRHQRETYFFLVPTSMQSWSKPIIELAMKYAEGDAATTADLVKALKEAKPYSCAWRPGALVQEAKGGNQFGKVVYDSRLKPKPYIAGSGGEIDCSQAEAKKKDPEGMAPVRKLKKDALIAVEVVDGQDWELNRNALGKATSKTRIVRIYEKVPRLPPDSISMNEFKRMSAEKSGN